MSGNWMKNDWFVLNEGQMLPRKFVSCINMNVKKIKNVHEFWERKKKLK